MARQDEVDAWMHLTHSVASGDVTAQSAVTWARASVPISFVWGGDLGDGGYYRPAGDSRRQGDNKVHLAAEIRGPEGKVRPASSLDLVPD